MKRKNGLWVTALLLAGVLTSGCSDDNQYGGSSAEPGSPVLFSVVSGGSDTRTIYESNLQINWVKGDLVGICSPSANVVDTDGSSSGAVYQVQEIIGGDGHQHHATITPANTSDYLKWGDNLETPAIFYGAYPAERIISYPSGIVGNSSEYDGIFKMKYITNQVCTVTSFENGNYQTQPDMKNAYMIAKNELKPKGDHVLLSFDPIMTTPDITITAGSYEVGTGIIQPVTVTGVSILMPKALNDSTLDYRINWVTNGPINKDTPRGELLNFMDSGWESVFVQIDNGGKRYVDLYEGESINLMAFLPPFLNLTGAKIRVHTLGATDFVKTINNPLQAQSKIKIRLPDVTPTTGKPNNWISKLEGSTLLKEMSIPAYVCSGNETSVDIEKLLRKGVRAFDATTLIENKSIKGNIKGTIDNFLVANNQEFIIVWVDNGKLSKRPENWIDFPADSKGISSIKSKVIILEKHYKALVGILGQDKFTNFNRLDKIFTFKSITTIIDLSSFANDWQAQIIKTEQDKNPIIENNKAIYNQIVTCKDQTGSTGIVTIPGADKSFDSSYGELLLQAVIDCNFKLRRNSKSNQQ